MIIANIIVLSLFLIFSGEAIQAESPCAQGWETYGNDKCIKVTNDTLKNYDDAIKTCHGLEATLLTIKSLEDQNTINKLLFKTHKIVDEIWIGAKNISKVFQWTDGSGLIYTNWAKDNPSNIKEKACVELMSDDPGLGKWANVACTKKNLIVCQKMQTWSLSHLQTSLLAALEELNSAKQEINNMKENPVPIGFIYIQYPSQPAPKTIWSSVIWSDVTSEYSGVFFRAEGGGSASFGNVQEENSPRLSSVATYDGGYNVRDGQMDVQPGQWSKKIYTGNTMGSQSYHLQFLVSSGEVRPRNKAVRIWKRTK